KNLFYLRSSSFISGQITRLRHFRECPVRRAPLAWQASKIARPTIARENRHVRTSAEVLEFEPLRQLVGRYISSAMGRRELDKLEPHHDRDRLVHDLAETGEAIEYLRLATRPQPASRGAAIRVDFSGL